jgi:tripeptidyl-peptidase-1
MTTFSSLLLASLLFSSSAEKCDFTVVLSHTKDQIGRLGHRVAQISSPVSADYGHYLSPDEINRFLMMDGGLKTRRELVWKWITERGYLVKNDLADAFVCHNPHCDEVPLIPSHLSGHIDFISRRPPPRRFARPKTDVRSSPSIDPGYVGREVVQRIYSIDNYQVDNQSACAIEFDDGGSGFSEDNLVQYERNNLIDPRNITQQHIHGEVGYPDLESQLDVQMLSNANDSQLWYWIFDKWIYDMALDLVNTEKIPHVISISYGWAEDDQCRIIDCSGGLTAESYIDRTNVELMKLALRGVSVSVSSGDAGAPGRTAEGCGSINPVFPGSSPYVTSIGAVAILSGDEHHHYQTPLCQQSGCANGSQLLPTMYKTTQWTSGGGFAIYDSESLPWYQASEVAGYLRQKKILPPAGKFNPKGRGYPDLAVIGHNCAVYGDGGVQPVDGTSCSSPLWASMVTVINRHQVSKGRPRVGFVNPLLYHLYRTNPATFTDITTGNNHATEYSSCNASDGFVASLGWDPVAGLGSPNIREIIQTLDEIF